tara:strand:- start:608 stop:811 length:204 start_codon:yes stop_codon:yes gene_type:complete
VVVAHEDDGQVEEGAEEGVEEVRRFFKDEFSQLLRSALSQQKEEEGGMRVFTSEMHISIDVSVVHDV